MLMTEVRDQVRSRRFDQEMWTRFVGPMPLSVSPITQRRGLASGDRTEAYQLLAQRQRDVGDLTRRRIHLMSAPSGIE